MGQGRCSARKVINHVKDTKLCVDCSWVFLKTSSVGRYGRGRLMNRTTAFGKAIRTLRKAKGLTQELLAERAGLHVNNISFVERGLSAPTLDTICALADALGLTVSEFAVEMERHANRHPEPAVGSLQ